MPERALLVANRGEVAIRIMRAAAACGLRTVAVCSEDDTACLHTRRADRLHVLAGRGPAAYLDGEALIAAARATGCDAVHPGYGFLAERADFAARCAAAGLRFVGPRPEVLEVFGDKSRARALAARLDVPLLAATAGPTTLEEARAFAADLPAGCAVMLKAIAGGGGRGLRVVHDVHDGAALGEAFARCRSEAEAAFGRGDLYVERLLPRARHVEVQIIGDGRGAVRDLGERECSLQRRHQKLVEIAPSPSVGPELRRRLVAAALRMAEAVRYESLGTFEFLVDAGSGPDGDFYFLEANPRLQVEHTVTEAVTGVDLVVAQLRIAAGASLAELGLGTERPPPPRGHAIQLRLNMETMAADGDARPAGGTLTVFEPPSGPGVRVDGLGYAGYVTSPRFDSLLAKIVVHAEEGSFAAAVTRAARALSECRVEGVPTNLGFLQALLAHPAVVANQVDTGFVERHAAELVAASAEQPRRWFMQVPETRSDRERLAGARVDSADPLAVLAHGKSGTARAEEIVPAFADELDGAVAVRAEMQGTIVAVEVEPGAAVTPGQTLVVMEAMKMEHVVAAAQGGVVRRLGVAKGDTVFAGHLLAVLEPDAGEHRAGAVDDQVALEHVRPDLAEARERHAVGLDAARPEAVERRRSTGQRTARENVDDLCDPGTFVEYGALVIAAQRQRRSLEDLMQKTPADGLVAGIGSVNAASVPEARASVRRSRLRLHRARRHPGCAEPPQEGPHARDRGTAPPSRSCCSARAAAGAPATPTRSASPGSTCRPSRPSRASRAWCRWSGSTPATASPATRRCSAAATS